MRGGRRFPAWVAAALLAPLFARALFAQQQPIFGCHSSPSCRPGPLRASGINDPSAQGLLFGVGASWGPGFHIALVTPLSNGAKREEPPSADVRSFHLWGARLLPPNVTPTPAASNDSSREPR